MNGKHWDHKKIVLIDDDYRDVELAMEVFGEFKLKNQVRVFYEGEKAIASLFNKSATNWHPCLIIVDLKMPKLNGLEILKQIKEHKRLFMTPVVVFTSSKEERDVERAVYLGANAYVLKPVEFDKFYLTIKRMIEFWIYTNINIDFSTDKSR